MQLADFIEEFTTDWRLAGKAASTAEQYAYYLHQLAELSDTTPTLQSAKAWLASAPSARTARGRANAIRAFGKWAAENDGPDFSWWRRVPLAAVAVEPQPTATVEDYERARSAARSTRDRLVIELLWSSGLRVSELARLTHEDVSLTERYVVVRRSKTGKPRLAPISDRACRLVRRLPDTHDTAGTRFLGMSRGAIQQLMQRLGAPSPHAWRRGWAVHSLEKGVSETSVRAAGGWSSGAMVARYTSAVSEKLAIHEFVAAIERSNGMNSIEPPRL